MVRAAAREGIMTCSVYVPDRMKRLWAVVDVVLKESIAA